MGQYFKYEFFKGRSREPKTFYCDTKVEAEKMAERTSREDGYDSFRESKGVYEDWRRPDFTEETEWFQWMHIKAVGGREDILFLTDDGTEIILKWQKSEYRAFKKKTNEDMRLGAIRTENLIKYIKERY